MTTSTTDRGTPAKPTLRQIRDRATAWAAEQATREEADPALKVKMDELRAAEASFCKDGTRT